MAPPLHFQKFMKLWSLVLAALLSVGTLHAEEPSPEEQRWLDDVMADAMTLFTADPSLKARAHQVLQSGTLDERAIREMARVIQDAEKDAAGPSKSLPK